MSVQTPRIVIAGAGPAGMTLAYLLASNGLPVRVLERHPDFEREFRGEWVQRSSVTALEKLGLVRLLTARGQAIPGVDRKMFVGRSREVMSILRKKYERGMLVSQPGLLQLLHEEASRFPSYRLDFGVSVGEPIVQNGRAVAVKTRTASGDGTVEGDLFVACNGRASGLRRGPGIEAESFVQPADALWLRFDLSDAGARLPKGVDVHMFGKGVVVVLFPTARGRLQIAYSAPGNLGELRRDLPRLRTALLPTLPPSVRELVEARLDEKTEWQILKIEVDRLKRWWIPGLLFLGDAAHQMSPSGAQGINLAFRDAIVAANRVLEAVKTGHPLDESVLASIEAERRPEVEAVQSRQIRAGAMVLKPLPALHVLCTIIGGMMWLFTAGGRKKMGEPAPVEIRYPVEFQGTVAKAS